MVMVVVVVIMTVGLEAGGGGDDDGDCREEEKEEVENNYSESRKLHDSWCHFIKFRDLSFMVACNIFLNIFSV